MLSPVSSQILMVVPFGSIKRLSTNFWVSTCGVKAALHADTTPRASCSESDAYSSCVLLGSTPTRRRNDGASNFRKGIVMGKVRMPPVHCTVLQTRTCSVSPVHANSSADNCTLYGRKESPRSEVMVIRQWTSLLDVFFSVTTRGVLRKRIYRISAPADEVEVRVESSKDVGVKG
jgi:hypothetical protein